MKKVFAIYDKASQTYGNPFVSVNTAVAVRDFWQACKEPKSPMALFPNDIEIHLIGEFDEESGLILPISQKTKNLDGSEKVQQIPPIPLAKAMDFFENIKREKEKEKADGQGNTGTNSPINN